MKKQSSEFKQYIADFTTLQDWVKSREVLEEEAPEWYEMLRSELQEKLQQALEKQDCERETSLRILRIILENTKNRIFEEIIFKAQILPFTIFPPGEKDVNETQNTTSPTPKEAGEHQNRIGWALDIARVFDPKFIPSLHYLESSNGKYHVLLFPSYARCLFVCNEYSNATYITPIENWEYLAQTSRFEDLKKAAEDCRKDQSLPWITWFKMPKDENAWRSRTVYELTCPAEHIQEKPRESTTPKGTWARFVENFEKLLKWMTEHDGNYPSNSSHHEEEKKLGDWLDNRRSGWKNMQRILKGELPKGSDRFTSQEEEYFLCAGIILDTEAARWEEFKSTTKALLKYMSEHEWKYPSKKQSKELRSWLNDRRKGWRNMHRKAKGETLPKSANCMSPREEEYLLNAGIVLDIETEKWEEFKNIVKALFQWITEHGKEPSAHKDKEEKKLADWLKKRRSGWKNMQCIANGEPVLNTDESRLCQKEAEYLLQNNISLTLGENPQETLKKLSEIYTKVPKKYQNK